MKYKTNKLKKLEKNRFSILQEDTSKCAICGSTYQLTWHEVFGGTNRLNSMKYGLCLRLCLNCHRSITNNNEFLDHWHKKGQQAFIEKYDLEFIDIFYKNYL